MSFLNAALLGGLFALAIPVLIHLLHKSRFKVVPWGAMHLLETVIRTNRRRVRIEQWLLLLLRTALPALLALAMARPIWKGSRSLLGDAATSTILLLDNSYSMQASHAGVSTFSLAQQEAAHIIGGLRHGSEVQVVLMGQGGAPILDQPTYDPVRAIDALGQVTADAGTATVPYALGFASGIFEGMHESARNLVVLTDFQKISFEPEEEAALGQALDRLRQMPSSPQITFFDVGQEVRDNVAVESLDFSKLMVGVGQKIQIRGNLRNYGDASYADLRVYFKVDGKEKAVSQVNLGPRQTAQVLFTHAFENAGSHVVEVYADADPLKADNSAQASLTVRDRVPVLLVDGDPSPEPLKSETAFAEIALQPYGAAHADATDLLTSHVIRPEELNAKLLSTTAMVLLANVRKLDDGRLHLLEEFVRNGGGLLVAPGNRIDPKWYATSAFQDGRGLLPAGLGALAGDANGAAGVAIVAERFEHPALEIFNDPRNGSLAEASLKAWYKLLPSAGAVILARLENGDPFLVEKPYGEGRVVEICTAIDADWSNLPMRSLYLPLMQRLSVYLASTVYPPRNVEVGHAIAAFLPVEDAGKKVVVTLPDGSTAQLPVVKKGSRGVVEFARTQQPGVYTLLPVSGQPLHYVVNVSRRESDLEKLSPEAITKFGVDHGVTVVHDANEFRQSEQLRRYGHEVWQGLLWLVLIGCFAEIFLQQRFAAARGRA